MGKVRTGSIEEFRPDPRNARAHNARNAGMIERSMERDGFGRSFLATADGTIIAGNQSMEGAANAGITDAIIVHTDGTKAVIVVRDDVTSDSERAYRLAIADNRANELSVFDPGVIEDLASEIDLSDFWTSKEMEALQKVATPPDAFPSYDASIQTDYECPKCGYTWSGKAASARHDHSHDDE